MLDLRDRGYSANELRSFAGWEEFWINNFAELDLEYQDDDVELLLRHHRGRLASAESLLEFSEELADVEGARKDVEQAKAQISILEGLRSKTLNPNQQEKLKRVAFSVRAVEEVSEPASSSRIARNVALALIVLSLSVAFNGAAQRDSSFRIWIGI
jgi:hypothetical protein